MKKILTIFACAMLLPAMAFAATDKKDDKNGGKGGKGTKDEDKPVIIITWDFDWPPIFRAVE